jgi:hypothetical protein
MPSVNLMGHVVQQAMAEDYVEHIRREGKVASIGLNVVAHLASFPRIAAANVKHVDGEVRQNKPACLRRQ